MAPAPRVITMDAPADRAVTRAVPRAKPMMTPTVTSVALVRVLFVATLAITGALWPQPTTAQTAVFYVWGLVWLPWSIAMLFISGSRHRRIAIVGGPVVDIAVLLASLAVFPDAPGLFMVAMLVAIVAAWLTWDNLSRGWSTGAVVVAAACVRIPTSQDVRGVASSVAFALMMAVACLIWIRMDRISARAEILTSSLRSRAETVLARVPHPLIVSGPGGRIVNCNPSTIEVIGAFDFDAPCCEALGLHFGERALDCAHGCALLELCRDTEGGYVEVWRLREDGTRQPLLASAAEVPDSQGRIVEIVHSIRDITRLKEADEAKTIFLATASHELKTPLTVINGYAQLLLRDDTNPSLRRQGLEAIASRAKELAEIVERLLLSSRIESGRLAVTIAPLDLAAVVRERVEALATATEHVINIHIQPGLPPVAGDSTAVATVLDHLVDNAIKYTSGDRPIDVFVAGCDQWIALSVQDHGVGMGEEQRRRCFDKFWQAESGDSRRHGGTGLGLYIVKSLVEAMAGRVSVDSQPGAGTQFLVTLPTPGGHLPAPRPANECEHSVINEFKRQVAVAQNVGS